MSAKVHNNLVVRHNKIPFQILPSSDEFDSDTTKNSRDTPKLRNVVDRLVGNLRKQRRYLNDDYFKHQRLTASESVEGEQNFTGTTTRNKRSSSVEKIDGLVDRSECSDFRAPPEAYMGRRRSKSDSELSVSCEVFARRRLAICEEMERSLLMKNGVTLRKCRKNLVLNQILENLSLL